MAETSTVRRGLDVVEIGETYTFYKTITDADITLYGGLVGDLGRIHFDEEFAKKTPYGRRLAAGTMLLGFMSASQTMLSTRLMERAAPPNVSYGYDRVRFTGPVFVGDTIATSITVSEKHEEKGIVLCDQRCVNQRGQVVCVATHILKFV